MNALQNYGTPQIPLAAPQRRIVGIEALAVSMRSQFAAQGINANVTAVGWRLRSEQINQGVGGANRIVLYPGKEPSGGAGAGGSWSRDHRPTTITPAILTWDKLITMSVWAADVTDTYNEETQLTALETLVEQAAAAVHNATDLATGRPIGGGAIVWGDVRWSKAAVERGFGLELLVEFTQRCPLFFPAVSQATPQSHVRSTL